MLIVNQRLAKEQLMDLESTSARESDEHFTHLVTFNAHRNAVISLQST
jgi:hypothetical protein